MKNDGFERTIGAMSTDGPPSAGTQGSRALSVVPLVSADYSSKTLLQDEMMADMLADGITLAEVCRTLGLPPRTVYDRIDRDEPFARLLDKARAIGYDTIAARVMDVVRGVPGQSSGDVKRDRMIAEYDVKLLSKWHPTKYGDKFEVKTTSNVTYDMGEDPVEAARRYGDLMKG